MVGQAVDAMNNRVETQSSVSRRRSDHARPTARTSIVVQLAGCLRTSAQAEKDGRHHLPASSSTTGELDCDRSPPTAQPAANGVLTGDATRRSRSARANAQRAWGRARTVVGGRRGAGLLRRRIKLAAKQPLFKNYGRQLGGRESGSSIFGAPGSAACAAYASGAGHQGAEGRAIRLVASEPGTDRSSQMLRGDRADEGEPDECRSKTGRRRAIGQSTAFRYSQAAPPNFAWWPKFGTAGVGYYVIRDRVALRGDLITNPAAGTDNDGHTRRHVRLPEQRRQPVPERHCQTIPSAAGSTPRLGPDLCTTFSTSRYRARQPAGQRPLDQLQDDAAGHFP